MLSTIIEALRDRSFPFRLLQKKLGDNNMPTAQGWELLLHRYAEETTSQTGNLDDWERILTEIYINHLRYGKKVVILYPIEQQVALQLIEIISAVDYTTSPFYSSYPFPLIKEKLSTLFSAIKPTAFENEGTDGAKRLVLCAKHIARIREQFGYDTFDTSFRDALSNQVALESSDKIEELIIVCNRITQSFDSIVIRPNQSRLEIQIDMSSPLNKDDLAKITTTHVSFIRTQLAPTDYNLSEPVNFFPCIERLYQESDGSVSRFVHRTNTNSIKNERMGRKKDDLRNESFHKSGLEAVSGNTDPSAIAKSWDSINHWGNPEVIIEGNISHTATQTPSITQVIIDGCLCREDFEMVLAKIT